MDVVNYQFNLFIPDNIEGSATAIMAHMAAHDLDGAVTITRCRDSEHANQRINELLHYITMADGYNAPQPAHRQIWIVGQHLSGMVLDELVWFGKKGGRVVLKGHGSYDIYRQIGAMCFPPSLSRYIDHVYQKDYFYHQEKMSGDVILRNMLAADEYEHLMAYLLRTHPQAEDVTKEDYVVNMFVEHAKVWGTSS